MDRGNFNVAELEAKIRLEEQKKREAAEREENAFNKSFVEFAKTLPANKAGDTVYDYVEEQYDLTYGEFSILGKEHCNDLSAVEASAVTQDQSYADAQEHSTERDYENFFVCYSLHVFKDT